MNKVEPVKIKVHPGVGAFMWDVLRHDQAAPATLETVAMLGAISQNGGMVPPHMKGQEMEFVCYSEPTPGRWLSFCWTMSIIEET